MTQQSQHEKVDVNAAALGFIFWGIIYAIVMLFVTIASRHDNLPPFFWWMFCAGIFTGVGMVFVGVGLRKRWRYILVAAVPIFIFGLFQFPVGTAVFGWALRSLWYSRRHFFPFDKHETVASYEGTDVKR
jgi:lysylphosphatidylglycerol synthetase-like protein (DUF2156 family)